LLTTGNRTADPRHRTLRAVIAWSWDLLNAHERTLAERISILPGGVTTASATALCAGTGVSAAEIPELLAGLVDRSLLQLAPEPGRYRMLETIREYGTDRLAETGDLDAVRDLAAAHFTELMARYDPQLRGPGQLTAMRVITAEHDNALAALRRRCDTGDADGAVALALSLTWYWQMSGRHSDAAYWLGEALAVPGGEPTPARDCAQAIYLSSRPGRSPEGDRTQIRELTDRLLASPELPGPYGVYALTLAFLQEEKTALAIVEHLADGEDVWLSGLARLFRARIAENAGDLGRMRSDVTGALARFRQAGDRWGQAAALPIRARLHQYDGDLDGALADLREARTLAAELGSLSLGDQVFNDLRWIDLYLRRGDDDLAVALIDAARERALRAASEEILVLFGAWEAGFRVRLGDLDRAGALLDEAERDITLPNGHARALISSARASLRLELGDLTGAENALEKAYAAALETREPPMLSLVAVNVAALAEAYGRHRASAVLLGAASRLRGGHDRTDRQIRELTRRVRAALGEEGFATAYGKGWELDQKTAGTEADPARQRLRAAHPDPG
ncbi:MAG: AfsR/SARP family transcriptional regulator, partial [Nonomuraea sp.]|nr:AfsR/SARP family transcriptional regulator [Nonomuraea sp.]